MNVTRRAALIAAPVLTVLALAVSAPVTEAVVELETAAPTMVVTAESPVSTDVFEWG